MFGGGGIRKIESIIETKFIENEKKLKKSLYLSCVDCKAHIILEDKKENLKYLLCWVYGDIWSVYKINETALHLETSTLDKLIEKIVIPIFESAVT